MLVANDARAVGGRAEVQQVGSEPGTERGRDGIKVKLHGFTAVFKQIIIVF